MLIDTSSSGLSTSFLTSGFDPWTDPAKFID